MRWEHPGQEFDEVYQEILAVYGGKKIVIYGAGMMGSRTYDAIVSLTDLEVCAFLDRDESISVCKGLPVYHGADEKKRLAERQDVIVVVGLPDETGTAVKGELVTGSGFREECCKLYSQFVMHDLPIIALCQNGKVFLDSVSLIVTEYCTLSCEKCAIMLPWFRKRQEYPCDKLMRETDALFARADFIGNYTITGGEPLLQEKLDELIRFTGERYRNRMGSFKLITNGTVMPSRELLSAMKKYDMAVEISDYTKAVPSIRLRVEETKRRFEEAGIKTYFLTSAEWVDFGFETVDNGYSQEQLAAFFDYCHTRCRGYVDGKLRYCINAYFAERTLHGREDEDNAFDLVSMGTGEEERRKLVEFDLGYNKKGFLNMCRHCNGTVEVNRNFIEVGKQCSNR